MKILHPPCENLACNSRRQFPPACKCTFLLARLAFRPCELLSSLFVRRPSSVVRRPSSVVRRLSSVNISHFNLLLRNHWANCNQTLVEWSLDIPLPTKIAAKLKIEKRGDEILIVHCCFSISQNELKF
jgi:hypothetical protein